jgi:hypothetical protein
MDILENAYVVDTRTYYPPVVQNHGKVDTSLFLGKETDSFHEPFLIDWFTKQNKSKKLVHRCVSIVFRFIESL